MTLTRRELEVILDAVADIERLEGGTMFMGRPDRWWDAHAWRCINDHVSTTYLKSEERGALCLAGLCREPLLLTFPEDADGPLDITRRAHQHPT